MKSRQFFTWSDWGVVLLGLGIIASGIGVAYSQHLNRKIFAELQLEEQTRDLLHVEWNQLLLEEGAWASNARIERVAHETLNMEIPPPSSIVVIGNDAQ